MPGKQQFVYLTIPAAILFIGTGFSRIFIVPHYSAMVEWVTRGTELVTACLLFILIVGQL